MPVYEYQREDGSIFEMSQRMSDAALEICPTTGQKVRRLISGGSGVIYKGDGWYVTDYKNGGSASASNKEETKSPESKPESSSETATVSTDNKTE
jgi:putative FmdB family regulatory protein